MGSTLEQMSMEMCWMHAWQCQTHQPFQVMLVQYRFLGRSHYYSMNQSNLTLKDNPKEEIIGGRHLFQ